MQLLLHTFEWDKRILAVEHILNHFGYFHLGPIVHLRQHRIPFQELRSYRLCVILLRHKITKYKRQGKTNERIHLPMLPRDLRPDKISRSVDFEAPNGPNTAVTSPSFNTPELLCNVVVGTLLFPKS
jgi:hypothetical protein